MDLFKDGGRSVIHTVAATFTFGGRARIVDTAYYWFAAMLAGLLIGLPANVLAWDQEWFANQATDIILLLPIFALFARRLHDQGLSGWWALLLLPGPPVNIYESYRAVLAVQHPAWLHEPSPVDAWSPWLFAIMLVVVVLLLRPGTRGPNRYGPDPREQVPDAV